MFNPKISLAFLAGGLAVLTAASLTGCGQQVSGGGGDDKTLTYWSSWSEGEPQQKIFADIIKDFEKQTGVEVDVRWLGRDYVSTVNNANAVGDGPDLYDDASDHIAEFRSKDGVGDLSGVLDREIPGESVTVEDVIPEAVLKASSDSEGLGMIPYSVISTAVWFDAAAHPEWVDAPPATFDDFLAVAEEIKVGGEAPIAQDGTINFYNAYWYYWLQMRHGGPGSLAALGESADAWDAPSVTAAATDVERLVKAGLFQDDYMGTKFPAAQNAWAAGDNAFNLNGSWLVSETAPNMAAGFDAQTFPFPAVDGGEESVEVGALGWTINAKAKNPDAAEEFLAFALQKKYFERISTDALNISSRSDVPAPEALAGLQEDLLAATSVNSTYDSAPALHAGWWNDVFLPLSDKLLAGSITAADFVAQGKQLTTDYLAQQ